MNDVVRPVRLGILLGLFGLLFGISWAFWLILGHDNIHAELQARGAATQLKIAAETVKPAPDAPQVPRVHDHKAPATHVHKDGTSHQHTSAPDAGKDAASQAPAIDSNAAHAKDHHDDPMMALSHRRLTRGHLHAMGLGLLAIVISIVIALTTAPNFIKTIASISTGLGGLVYPLAWIAMGYRTPSLGPDAAEASVTLIAGPGVLLVATGISLAIVFILKDLFLKSEGIK